MKPDINWNHRGIVTLNTGDEINFETEFRNDIVLPMQRFTDTIKYGIFFYGFAPDEEQQAAENLEQPRERAEFADTEEPYKGGFASITSPGVTKDQVPLDVQKCLARMRCNFAHCS